MTSAEIRKRFLSFFEKRGHAIIPSASLIPENDPTTLFTGSGMQPLLPYLLGDKHPKGKRLANSQKSFRAEDIAEVGDNRHTTFFEMLGNWSLGDYWKEEQLAWSFEFLTKEIGLSEERLWVTCFAGDAKLKLPADNESVKIWRKIGIPEERIRLYDAKKNWWSRAGAPEQMPSGEPGGPDSEVFFDFGPSTSSGQAHHDPKYGAECHPNCECGRFMEIGNSVFMQYVKKDDLSAQAGGSFGELPQKNVDFGGGLERITAAANDDPDVFLVDTLLGIIRQLEISTGKKYKESDLQASFRIVADHIRAAVFMISDGVTPSNTEQGYLLRRLIRRSVMKVLAFSSPHFFALGQLAHTVAEAYGGVYPALYKEVDSIAVVITDEETRFRLTLEKGLKEFEKMIANAISGKEAFMLFSTYGFPLELTLELAKERGVNVDTEGFQEEFEKHQEISRKGAEKKFKGGLADANEKTIMLHTATHLMLAGLRKYLGGYVHQAGSNITTERTRFDFTHPEKVNREILDKVEAYVNKAIKAGAEVVIERMPKEEAQKSGVEGSFWEKYPDVVNVYKVIGSDGTAYSQELCGGPHVRNTGTITGKFKIVKEEAVAAGIRRIKAVLE